MTLRMLIKLLDRHKDQVTLTNYRFGLIATLLSAPDEDGEKTQPLDWFKPKDATVESLRKLKKKAGAFNARLE